jgi:hypothetical protein
MCNQFEIWSLQSRNTEFGSIFAANQCFLVKSKATPLDFDANFYFVITHKNLYTRPLCVTDLEFGLYD